MIKEIIYTKYKSPDDLQLKDADPVYKKGNGVIIKDPNGGK
jgi:hypothetical protein